MVRTSADNLYSHASYIVDASAAKGSHTTIASAITTAGAGPATIAIRAGTYTENFTLPENINLVSYDADALTPTVTIVGKITATSAGTRSISGIRLQTNGDFLLAVTGSEATVIYLKNCYLNMTNNTGISHTSSSASSLIVLDYCRGSLGTTGITLFVSTSLGGIVLQTSQIGNSGGSTTASSTSAGPISTQSSYLALAFSTSSTGSFAFVSTTVDCSAINTACLTTAGTAQSTINNCQLSSGTASSLSVGAGTTVIVSNTTVSSSNTNAITGAGTVTYGDINFIGTSSLINTTTQTYLYSNVGKYKATGQPCVVAYQSGNQANVTGDGTSYTIIFDTETKDQDSNFNNATGVFTAPVAGVYLLIMQIQISNIGAAHTSGGAGFAGLSTSSQNNPANIRKVSTNIATLTASGMFSLAASATFSVTVTISGSTKTIQVDGGADKTFLNVILVA